MEKWHMYPLRLAQLEYFPFINDLLSTPAESFPENLPQFPSSDSHSHLKYLLISACLNSFFDFVTLLKKLLCSPQRPHSLGRATDAEKQASVAISHPCPS